VESISLLKFTGILGCTCFPVILRLLALLKHFQRQGARSMHQKVLMVMICVLVFIFPQVFLVAWVGVINLFLEIIYWYEHDFQFISLYLLLSTYLKILNGWAARLTEQKESSDCKCFNSWYQTDSFPTNISQIVMLSWNGLYQIWTRNTQSSIYHLSSISLYDVTTQAKEPRHITGEVISRGGGAEPPCWIAVHFGMLSPSPKFWYWSYFPKYINLASNVLWCITMINFITATWLLKPF